MSERETAIREKMREKGVMEAAIAAFTRALHVVEAGPDASLIPEESLAPAQDVMDYEELSRVADIDPALLAQTVVIKLNGGLGTSMGLEKAKSLLEVRPGITFLDLMVKQMEALRSKSGATVRFLLMNSQATSADTKAHLAAGDIQLADPEELELMQNWVPKLTRETLSPVSWPDHPEQEWCPPGHADIYPSLAGSGWLDRLLKEGIRYAFISNSDNLGATLDPTLLAYMAETEAPFLMEVTRRTEADKKGGHLATRKQDGRLVLREVAQCPQNDLDAFQDIDRHRYFNTNNVWLNLVKLKEVMEQNQGVMPLPVIVNAKTVDPRDTDSTPVYQMEQAMGSAIECFAGAKAVNVPRMRFAPVKSTADLWTLRSDACELEDDGTIHLATARQGKPPVVSLSAEYKFVEGLETLGMPSLIQADEVSVKGRFSFAPGVRLEGKVRFENASPSPVKLEQALYRDEIVSC